MTLALFNASDIINKRKFLIVFLIHPDSYGKLSYYFKSITCVCKHLLMENVKQKKNTETSYLEAVTRGKQ